MPNKAEAKLQSLTDYVSEELICLHCGNFCPTNHSKFCCVGCEAVYGFIQHANLGAYYSQKKETGTAVSKLKHKLENYDHPDLKAKFSFSSLSGTKIKVFVPDVHCAACLWILEKLPEIYPGISRAKLDMSTNLLELDLLETGSIVESLKLIQNLGYRTKLVKREEDLSSLVKIQKSKSIRKLGITAAVTGNIMLMTTSVYGGATGFHKDLFSWISFALASIVVSYSASEFYKNSLTGWKQRTFSIDYSLAIAVLAGYLVSSVNLIRGSEHVFFDSIAGLTFLILCSRYVLKNASWQNLSSYNTTSALCPELVLKQLADKSFSEVLPENLAPGDVFKVLRGQRVPCDGELISAQAEINESVLSGENTPLSLESGGAVRAGSLNLRGDITVRANTCLKESYIHQVIDSAAVISKSQILKQGNKYAKTLSIISHLFALLALIGFGFFSSIETGINIALSILIISCPCAFAIATPLSLRLAYNQLARWGIIAKNIYCIENLTKIKNIVFDKTGTLTDSALSIQKLEIIETRFDEQQVYKMFTQLEENSEHPVGKSIYIHSKSQLRENLDTNYTHLPSVKEILGVGPSVKTEIGLIEVRDSEAVQSRDQPHTKRIGLFINKEEVAYLCLRADVRPEAVELLKKIAPDYILSLLSGDQKVFVDKLAKDHNYFSSVYSEKSPTEKASIVAGLDDCLMIGDGINDSLAFKKAKVGIAMEGSLELAFRSSDLYLNACDIGRIYDILALAKRLKSNIESNYAFSILFNIVFISLAFMGYVSPLVAAIVMPVSSLILSLKSSYFLRNRQVGGTIYGNR